MNEFEQKDYEGARNQERNMETNKQAFINANLAGLDESIKDIETFINRFFDKKGGWNSCSQNRFVAKVCSRYICPSRRIECISRRC